MACYEIEFPLALHTCDAVEAALLRIGACSITYEDRGDEPVLEPAPGEMRLWRDTLVRALFDETEDAARSLCRLGGELGAATLAAARVRAVADRDWRRAWLADWRSMRFGSHLWVCPTSAPPPPDLAAIVVRLDPGLAFGSGTHATTAMCLEGLCMLDLRAKSVLDYGCGSGILAIAALRLGAAEACCVDRDPQALTASRRNAIDNGVGASLRTQDTAARLEPADCVLANILAGTLIELAPTLGAACKPGGDLLLSGVLAEQEGAVTAAYRPHFAMVAVRRRDDWCCIHARRRTAACGVS